MPTNKRIFFKDAMWVIVFAGIVAAILRFSFGLGFSTGLNDTTPWGLWIAFKLGFVALAGGGFTLAGMVYILRLETFRPIIRRATLLALLGYGSFIISLIFDLGLPWNIYMPVIHWQHHSVMFEIAWCVILYFSVLVLEFSPVILEHTWFQRPFFQGIVNVLHKLLIPLVIAGIVLSTLHQSSLGSLFLIMPHRVHPLWYSPLIPVLFFVSAITVGLLALTLEGFVAARFFERELDFDLVSRLGKIAGLGMWLYLALRVGDLLWRGVLPQAIDGTWQSVLFLSEIFVGGILPAILLAVPKIRQMQEGLITGAILGIMGIVSQRMSLSMFTMVQPGNSPYIPSFLEVIIALAIPAAAALIYFLFNENLAVLDKTLPDNTYDPYSKPTFNWQNFFSNEETLRYNFTRRSGVAVVIIAITLAGARNSIDSRRVFNSEPVQGANGWEVLKINGNQAGRYTDFPHTEHQDRQLENYPEEEQACRVCHHLSKPGDGPTSCWECHTDMYYPTSIFDHSQHQQVLGGNQACSECHANEHTAATATACKTCHDEMIPDQNEEEFNYFAPGYKDAMHGLCISCHEDQAEQLEKTEMDQCATCHHAQTEDG